ncbi:hypothetical protein [Microvirga sp. CF3016]|uniref:hypothetical protein n=1 Tax=Microvirga sp. CF3016 TaxID=3110181 RepID=UPI002E781DA9|nr:hypothetical protein [Microvirga sp. CF3016]MEE1611345.1 hypothetical protein [Microvirga sp. CF3016]
MRHLRSNGAGIAAFLLSLALAAPGLAQGLFGDPDERRESPPSLPQSFNGIIRPPSGEEIPKQVDTLNDIVRAMQACWRPAGVRYSGQSVTIRISFKRNGEVLGKPMITHYREGEPDAANREAFTQAVREALVRCSPMPFSDKLGAAVAGRPFTFRFVDSPATEKQQFL